MKQYDIYQEGFITNGEYGLAGFIGIGYGNNFLEACKEYHERTGRGELKKCLDGSYYYADWGCRWFPTLKEAQELCG